MRSEREKSNLKKKLYLKVIQKKRLRDQKERKKI